MKILYTFFLISIFSSIYGQPPNILLVIADDLGVDYVNGYHDPGNLMPTTPTIDSLRSAGITFRNVFSAPVCTPTRATIMSGKHGVKTGVLGVPGNLDTSNLSIFRAIEAETNGLYSDAVIGKWHISFPTNPMHPDYHEVDYYTGFLSGGVSDYYAWNRTENGITTLDTNYITTALTDASINWINTQTQPWFLWLAHAAPHTPYHVPPDSLYSIPATGTNKRKYIAMVEAIDTELGRLFHHIPQNILDNTIVIFLGDNGTPNNILQNYPSGHGKGTLYEGGIKVPMIISGAGVTRIGEQDTSLIQVTDIYATLLEIVGASLPGGIYNSLSFKHLLDNTSGNVRDYNYSDFSDGGTDGYTIRNSRYKLIESITGGTQEFYDLWQDSLETNDLLVNGLNNDQNIAKLDLEQEALQRRNVWSCKDHIQNGNEVGIDCGGSFCSPCSTSNLNEIGETGFVKVYPNPTQGLLLIENAVESKLFIEVFDLPGLVIYSRTFSATIQELDISTLPSGIYFLKITNESNGEVFTRKILKK